jgi:hypothetical protein
MAKITVTTNQGEVIEVLNERDIGDLTTRMGQTDFVETMREAIQRARRRDVQDQEFVTDPESD